MARPIPSDTNTSSARSDSNPSPVWVGVWLGLVVAAVNLSVYAIKHYGLVRIAFVSRDVWWTLPLTNAFVFGAIGLVFVARLRRDARWLGAVFVCTVISATSILLNLRLRSRGRGAPRRHRGAGHRFAAKHRARHVTVRRTVRRCDRGRSYYRRSGAAQPLVGRTADAEGTQTTIDPDYKRSAHRSRHRARREPQRLRVLAPDDASSRAIRVRRRPVHVGVLDGAVDAAVSRIDADGPVGKRAFGGLDAAPRQSIHHAR